MYNFVDQCLRGDALVEDIDDFIEKWHDTETNLPVNEFLGMSIEEYGAWVEDSDVLPYIITAHKYKLNLKDAISQSAAMAARSDTLSKTNRIKQWLNDKGLGI